MRTKVKTSEKSARHKYWVDKLRAEPRRLTFQEFDIPIPGVSCHTACVPEMPMPVCTLYWRWVGYGTVEVLDVYTVESYRRQGVATRLLDALYTEYHPGKVITGSANSMSEGLLRKCGFQQAEHDGWARISRTQSGATNKKKGKAQ